MREKKKSLFMSEAEVSKMRGRRGIYCIPCATSVCSQPPDGESMGNISCKAFCSTTAHCRQGPMYETSHYNPGYQQWISTQVSDNRIPAAVLLYLSFVCFFSSPFLPLRCGLFFFRSYDPFPPGGGEAFALLGYHAQSPALHTSHVANKTLFVEKACLYCIFP